MTTTKMTTNQGTAALPQRTAVIRSLTSPCLYKEEGLCGTRLLATHLSRLDQKAAVTYQCWPVGSSLPNLTRRKRSGVGGKWWREMGDSSKLLLLMTQRLNH